MSQRVAIQPELLRWACERTGASVESFAEAHPKLRVQAWVSGESAPTLKQLEDFAKATRTPVGYFFLPEPPEEPVPIPDFRTMAGKKIQRPSPNLLDTIYICQQRQDWFREYLRATHEPALKFVASVDRSTAPAVVAARMRAELGFRVEERARMGTWSAALRSFIQQAEDAGVLVMMSGIVGSNTSRRLDPEEFRGFALSDPHAPLVFLNGADTRSAQMFTLAHELAHIWLGETALSDPDPRTAPDHEAELWCNQVAAELLVPMAGLLAGYTDSAEPEEQLQNLARAFKVSTLVVLRRLYDAGKLPRKRFWEAYDAELARLLARDEESPSGGHFYHSTATRVGKRFARALIGSTLEGRASFSEALRLLGLRKMSTFRELGRAVGEMKGVVA